MNKLQETIQAIKPIDREVMQQAQVRLDSLTKPVGSLGVLEKVVRQIAGITGTVVPPLPRKTCILMAGDHGVVAEGVSAYPQEVTPQMVLNFVSGGAAMNVLCRHVGADLRIVDIGVAQDLPPHPVITVRKVAYGTRNMAQGPAMTVPETVAALTVGIEVVSECIDQGAGLVGIGEMGIGNTTPSAALAATYTGLPVQEVVGRGTGVDDARLAYKIKAIEQALAVNKPDPAEPLAVLAKIGGLEIAGMAGVVLGAAARRVPVVVDGFIAATAALMATRMGPLAGEYLIASHASIEPGHQVVLELLGLKPMLFMEMRLGEGTGAALGMSVIEAALKIMQEMATFSGAGISGACDGN